MGNVNWSREWLRSNAAKVQVHMDAVVELGAHDNDISAQAAFLILRYSAAAKIGHLLRMVPPQVMAEAAATHDEAVLSTLSLLLHPSDPLLREPADEDEEQALHLARCQALMPAAAGGLGLSSASGASEPAYVASWIDYLRFVHAHPSLFPQILPLISADSLEESDLPAVVELRAAWEELEERLQRPSVDQPGVMLPGLAELQALLGKEVKGVASLRVAKARSQTALTHACQKYAERSWREDASRADCTRLTDCGGKEAAWVSATPSRPEYELKSADWRDSFCNRLGVPKHFLASGPSACDCHDRFDRRTGAIRQGLPGAQRDREDGSTPRRRARVRPKPVDAHGEHDQRCKHAFSLGRHDYVQHCAKRKLTYAGIHAKLASVRELRGDSTDSSKRKADLECSNLNMDGNPTILDIGITHPLIDTNLNIKSTTERAFAANKYGDLKEKGYKKIIKNKKLDLHAQAMTFGSFGSFGKGTWNVINTVCNPDRHPHATGDFDPWNLPDPKRDFIVTLGFALQRANAKMVRDANLRRRRNRAGERYASSADQSSDSE